MIDIYNILFFFYYSIDNFFFRFRTNLKIKLKFQWNDLIILKKKFVIFIKEVCIYYIC